MENKISFEGKQYLISLKLNYNQFDDFQRLTNCYNAYNTDTEETKEEYKNKITTQIKQIESDIPNSKECIKKALLKMFPTKKEDIQKIFGE